MKSTSFLVLFLWTAGAIHAEENPFVVTIDKAEISTWEDDIGPGTQYIYNIGAVDILLRDTLNFGRYGYVSVGWKGKEGGHYEVNGTARVTANACRWNLGAGTYEFSCNLPILDSIQGEDETKVILNRSYKLFELSGLKELVLNAPNVVVVDYIWDRVERISSPYEINTRNLPGFFQNVGIVDGNIVVSGNKNGTYWDGSSGLTVSGNVHCASKVSFDFWTYHDGGKKMSAEHIRDRLSDLHDETLLHCESLTGKLSNLSVNLCYYDESTWRETRVSAASYGCFVAEQDAFLGGYNIVYKAFSEAQGIQDIVPGITSDGVCAYRAGSQDLYLSKAMNLAPKGEATLSWNAEGESVSLIGKGGISAKKLNVELDNGFFVQASGCGFKNADFELNEASFSVVGSLAAESFCLQSQSALVLAGGKLKVRGDIVQNMSSIVSDSALVAASLSMSGLSSLSIEATKATSLDLKDKNTTNVISDSDISVTGKMSVAGNLELAGAASIHLYDPSGKNKAMPLVVKGSLTLGSGSTLTLSGALSARDMVLDGGTINLTSNKPLPIKVGNRLDINGPVDLNLGFTVADKDVNKKSFKILTFKSSNLGGEEELYDLLGLSDSYCSLSFDKKKTSVMLTVTDKEAWDAYIADVETEAPTATTALVNPVLPDYSGVADALVQANWGLVESSRAFVNTIANRSMAVQLGSGERAVWASAIAGSSRRSSSGTHGGADTNITGGAIGMETQLGENSLLGMALGNSWTRVSAHNYGTIKQDTTHLGLYGQTNWNKLSADWSAAYGRSESKFNGSDWSQRAIQLDGRLSYNHALSETVLLRGFGGVQYYASDSARVDGLDTGEVQNLRGEVGVGIVRSTQKSSVYAELALHQDLVRDNPEVRSPFGQRYHGTNPGRTGINLTIGGSYALSDQWSVNASYTAEVVENANAHSVNVGATYKF